MKIKSCLSSLGGHIQIPGSKSHTIRGLIFASLASGESVLMDPLSSSDTLSCLEGCKTLGAKIEIMEGERLQFLVQGLDHGFSLKRDKIDVGNSGTSLSILTGIASLGDQWITFDGDDSIRSRPIKPLLDSLSQWGAQIRFLSNTLRCPFAIRGPIRGGKTVVEAVSSQYLTSLLIAAPLAQGDSEIEVSVLYEKPYVQMTLDWLAKQKIQLEYNKTLTHFWIKGNQKYSSFQTTIPSDFSTACFPLCAAAITQSTLSLGGLDFRDSQGDKKIFDFLKQMGMEMDMDPHRVLIQGNPLQGIEMDLNDTPDALPVLAVLGCFAKGKTVLKNVQQARIKECDRIAAMTRELKKMGGCVEEKPDGMIIHESVLKPTSLHGYHDHRIVMALALAGLGIPGETRVDSAESVEVTFPGFVESMKKLGAQIDWIKD